MMLSFILKWLEKKQSEEHYRLVDDVYCMATALEEHFKMMRAFQEISPSLLTTPKMSASEALSLCQEMKEGCKKLYKSLQEGQTLGNEDVRNLSQMWREFHMTINDIENGLSRGISALGGGSGEIPSPMERYKSLKKQKAVADGV